MLVRNTDRDISGSATHIQVQVGLLIWICVAFAASSVSPVWINIWAEMLALSAYSGFTNWFIPWKGLSDRGRTPQAEETTECASAAPRRFKAFIVVKDNQV